MSNKRRRVSRELALQTPNLAAEVFDPNGSGTAMWTKGLPPAQFIKMIKKCEGEGPLTLDLHEMTRAPRSKELYQYLIESARRAGRLRLHLTGEVSQKFHLEVLRAASEHLYVLEIKLPTYCKVAMQKVLMDIILSLKVTTLIAYGSFNCVHHVPPAIHRQPVLEVLKCPGDSKAKNNFVDELLLSNKESIRQLELCSDLKASTKKLTSLLPNLMLLGVESFKDLYEVEEVAANAATFVRGLPNESAAQVVDTIASCPESSFLRELEFLGLFCLFDGMDQVLEAVALHCPKLCNLTLIGWNGVTPLEHILKMMNNLVKFKLLLCKNIPVTILNGITTGAIFPNIKKIVIESSTFQGLHLDALEERLHILTEARGIDTHHLNPVKNSMET